MEARKDAVKLESTLASCAADILDHIALYLLEDEVFLLNLTGNRALRVKLSQMSTIHLVWKSSSFCDWNAALAPLSSTSHIRSLRLKTKYPFQCAYFDRLCWLPPKLTSLTLNYCGAVNARIPYSDLPLLTSLSITQLQAIKHDQSPGRTSIQMGNFPPHLCHLHILAEPQHSYDFLSRDLSKLPPFLETFDVNVQAYGDQVVFGRPNEPSSLTHLRVATFQSAVDVTYVASTLQHLQLENGPPSYGGESIQRLTSWTEGRPIRDIFPVLRTLQLPMSFTAPWNILETMPLSLTSFSARFDINSDQAEVLQICSELNEKYVSTHGIFKPGAPMMLREFRPSGTFLSFELLHHFPNLTSAHMPSKRMDTSETWLPTHLQSIFAHRLPLSLSQFPRSLHHLECSILIIPTAELDEIALSMNRSLFFLDGWSEDRWDQELQSPSPELQSLQSQRLMSENNFNIPILSYLPSLTHLKVTESALSSELIFILPSSITHLEATFNAAKPLFLLSYLAKYENRFPHLVNLAVKALSSPLQISCACIPTSVKSLTLNGRYYLTMQPSHLSLRNHPSLTELNLLNSDDPLVIFFSIPPQLLSLQAYLNTYIDMDRFGMVEAIMRIPPSLRSLSLTPKFYSYAGPRWIDVNPKFKSEFKWLLQGLLYPFRKDARLRVINGLPNVPSTERRLVAELFFFSCLPKTLNYLDLPIRASFITDQGVNMPTFFFWKIKSILGSICNLKFPLLGVGLGTIDAPSWSKKVTIQELDILPPHICCFPSMQRELPLWHKLAKVRTSRPAESDPNRRNNVKLTIRMLLQGLNLMVWLHLRYYLQLDYNSHPIAWCYQWSNLIGSALAVPILWFAQRQAPPPYGYGTFFFSSHSKRDIIVGCSRVLASMTIPATIFWLVGASTAVALGYTPSKWSLWQRIGAFVLASTGDIVTTWLYRFI